MNNKGSIEYLKGVEADLIDAFKEYDEGDGDWPLDDVLDIVYIINSDKSYRACRLILTLGGPTVFLNTEECQLELYWWNESATWPIDSDLNERIDEYIEELWGL